MKTKSNKSKNIMTPIMQGTNPGDTPTGRDEVREKLREHPIKHLQREDSVPVGNVLLFPWFCSVHPLCLHSPLTSLLLTPLHAPSIILIVSSEDILSNGKKDSAIILIYFFLETITIFPQSLNMEMSGMVPPAPQRRELWLSQFWSS